MSDLPRVLSPGLWAITIIAWQYVMWKNSTYLCLNYSTIGFAGCQAGITPMTIFRYLYSLLEHNSQYSGLLLTLISTGQP